MAGLEAESAEPFVGNDVNNLNIGNAQHVIRLAAVGAVGWNRGGAREANDRGLAHPPLPLRSQLFIEHNLLALRHAARLDSRRTEFPEAIRRTDEQDVRGPLNSSVSLGLNGGVGKENDGLGFRIVLLKLRRCGQFVRQFGAEKPIGDKRFIDSTESIKGNCSEAAADRIADQQRARQDRCRRRRSHRDGRIQPAIVKQACEHESPKRHHGSPAMHW